MELRGDVRDRPFNRHARNQDLPWRETYSIKASPGSSQKNRNYKGKS
jgi:hypothetical protein